MNPLKRGPTAPFPTHFRENANQVEVVPTSLHFNMVQAQLERQMGDRNLQVDRELDQLQELKLFINQLRAYKQKLQDKVLWTDQEYRDKKTEAEDAESIKEIDEMIEESTKIIIELGYEGIALDVLTHCPELAHKEFTKQGQAKIGEEISQTGKVRSS